MKRHIFVVVFVAMILALFSGDDITAEGATDEPTVIASGISDGPSNSKWILYDDGTLRSEGGTIHGWNMGEYYNYVKKIIILDVDNNIDSLASFPNAEEVIIKEGDYIPEVLFWGMQKLRKVEIPVSVVEIGARAFADCPSLETVVYDGTDEQWRSIQIWNGNGDLWRAKGISPETSGTYGKYFNWKVENYKLTIDGNYNYISLTNECKDSHANNCTPWYMYNDVITHIEFGERIEYFEAACFKGFTCVDRVTFDGGCVGFSTKTTENTIADTVELIIIKDIDKYVNGYFYNEYYKNVKVIAINGGTNIDILISGSTNVDLPLEKIYLPISLTHISSCNFSEYNFKNLQKVEYEGTERDWQCIDIEGGNELLWRLTDFSPRAAGTYGDISWEVDDWRLILSGTGEIPAPSEEYYIDSDFNVETPWYRWAECITEVEIPEGITRIGEGAFQGLNIDHIDIPTTVTTIGDYAFASCKRLKEIYIPANVTSLGTAVFTSSKNLDLVVIGAKNPEMNKNTFYGYTGTIAYYAGGSLDDYVAFYDTKKLVDAGRCSDRAYYALYTDGNLELFGKGDLGPFADYTYSPWYSYIDTITGYKIDERLNVLTELKLAQHITGIETNITMHVGTELDLTAVAKTEISYYLGENESFKLTEDGKLKAIKEGYSTFRVDAAEDENYYGDSIFINLRAEGHQGEYGIYEEATCTKPGHTAGIYCSKCGEIMKPQEPIAALGHIVVTDYGKSPTCTETGLTEGKHCYRCFEIFIPQDIIPATGHTEIIDKSVAPTCTETGLTEGKHCSVCREVLVYREEVPALGHTEVVDKAVAPTCTETGLTSGKHCSVCEKDLVAQKTVKALGHTEVIDKAVEPTCTEAGLTEGKHCLVCGEILEKQEEVPALGHTEVIDKSVAPTCTETGLTEGKHCSVCKEVLVARNEVSALGHTEVVDKSVAPTCIESGLTEGKHCSVCKEVLVARNEVSELGHTEVIDGAVAPTCTATGLTEGKHCSVCKEVLVARKTVAALGHTEVVDKAVDATCTETGLTEGKHCLVCEEVLVAQETVKALGHTEVIDKAVEATCTEEGLTEGKHCSVCEEVLVAQETVKALGHTEVIDKAVEPTCTEDSLTEGKHCSVCEEVLVAQETVKALGHTEVIDKAVEPTYTETGLTEGSHCSVCDEILVEQKVVDKLIRTGWYSEVGKWYLYSETGDMLTGWQLVSGTWYYMEADGAMVTGWKQIAGTWFFFDKNGYMTTGWKQISGKWYYFNKNGYMVTGWSYISNKWYYFTADGDMSTGWKYISNVWYYFTTNGDMATGWKLISGTYYYFDQSGAMKTGWVLDAGTWYYMDNSGAMVANKSLVISGKTYRFSGSGACLNP